MTTDRVYDVGVQAERTSLAWRRTALSVGLAAIVGARLTAPGTGAGALVAAAAGGVVAAGVWATSVLRYRAVHRALHGDGDLREATKPGAAFAGLAAVGTLTGVLGAVFVLLPD